MRQRGKLITIVLVVAGAGLIGLAMVLAALPLTVTGPRGTSEACGPSIVYFAPVDPVGTSPGSDDDAILDACKTAALGRNALVLLSCFPGVLLFGGAVIAYAVRLARRRTPK